jgi:peptide/nickel transport system permease protein
MGKFIAKRVVQMFLLFVVFLTVLFFLLEAQPGDLSQQYIGNPEIPPEAKVILIERLGLDQPLGVRYVNYMKNFFTGNFGNSLADWPRPVASSSGSVCRRTMVLFLSATLLAYYLGVPHRKVLAWRRGGHRVLITLVGWACTRCSIQWFAL